MSAKPSKKPPESWLVPKDFHGEPWHTMEGRVIREVIFGANDGLITAFGFVSGVGGAHIPPLLILLTGLAQAVAGAISMFFGAYLSTKAQRQYFEGEIERERRELETDPERETEEIREIYRDKGFSDSEIEMVVRRITQDKERWLSFMVREELGLVPEHFDSPVKVGLVIGVSFLLGALIPVIPYAFSLRGARVVWISSLLTLAALFAVGSGKTRITKTSWLSGGIEMLVVGTLAGGIGYAVGRLLGLLGLNPSA